MPAPAEFNVVVFASGGGGNFQALIDKQWDYKYKITLLVVDRECGAVARAENNKISHILIDKRGKSKAAFDEEIQQCVPKKTNLIVLAGFMSILSEDFCHKWENKIINSHPSLLPKYGGKGMIGVKVQEAVMNAKERVAGCTIHFVNKDIDGGTIILQKKIIVNHQETPWQLGGRIHLMENDLLPEAVKAIKTIQNLIK